MRKIDIQFENVSSQNLTRKLISISFEMIPENANLAHLEHPKKHSSIKLNPIIILSKRDLKRPTLTLKTIVCNGVGTPFFKTTPFFGYPSPL